MDMESLLAARLAFDAYIEQRSRVAETVPSLLMRSEVELMQLRAEEVNQRNNYGLLTEFTQALPTATGDALSADSVREARQVQASILWVQWHNPQGGPSTYHPFYIIGKCPVPKRKPTSKESESAYLLLSMARPRDVQCKELTDSLATMLVRADELEVIQQAAQSRKERDLGDRVKTMFDRDTQKLRVSYIDEDSMRTRPVAELFLLDNSPSPARLAKRTTWHGLSVSMFQTYNGAISDEDMVRFDVFTHLNQLAVDFGQEAHYRSLLDNHAQKAEALSKIREDTI